MRISKKEMYPSVNMPVANFCPPGTYLKSIKTRIKQISDSEFEMITDFICEPFEKKEVEIPAEEVEEEVPAEEEVPVEVSEEKAEEE